MKKVWLVVLVGVLVVAGLWGCGGGNSLTGGHVGPEDGGEQVGEEMVKFSHVGNSVCNTEANRNNCVFYARCRVPSLPYGLTYYSDKKRIINSLTPSVGSVAVMNIFPPYGHLAVVEHFSNGKIGVREGNNPLGQIRYRENTPSAMKVTGYFRP